MQNIGLYRLHDRIAGAAHAVHDFAGGARSLAQAPRVAEQGGQCAGHFLDVAHFNRAAFQLDRGIDVGEVRHVWSVQNGGAKLYGFNRVLPALASKRFADEDDAAHAVEHAKFADGVGDVELRAGAGRLAGRALADRHAILARHGCDLSTAFGMARGHNRQKVGELTQQAAMDRKRNLLLARVRGGRQPHRARADDRPHARKFCRICGQGWHVIFEIARHLHAGAAKVHQPRGVGGALGQAQIDGAQQRADGAGELAPAIVGALRHAGVDEHQRNAARVRLQKHVGPQFRFGEQRDVGAPMIEESVHVMRAVQRRKLVEHAVAKPVLHHARRGERACGQQHVEAARAQALDQRLQGQRLADAGSMQPCKAALGTVQSRQSAPLAQTIAILLAPAQTPHEPRGQERRGDCGERAIGDEQGRACIHGRDPCGCRRPAPGSVAPKEA